MNRVFFALVVFGVAHASHAERVTLLYSGVVTEAAGAPFGINAQVGVTPVTGWVTYDTPGVPPNPEFYPSWTSDIPQGFGLEVGGVLISSGGYLLQAFNNFGGSDTLVSRIRSTSTDFRVNGLHAVGRANVDFIDMDQTLWPTHEDSSVLPTYAQVGQFDFVQGLLADQVEGVPMNYFRFTGSLVPEPCAILLVAQSLCVLGRRRRMGCVVLISCRLSIRGTRAGE